jgi:hypothetical protein
MSLALVCADDHDLQQVLAAIESLDIQRHDSLEQALDASDAGDGILLLAGGYPEHLLTVAPATLDRAVTRGVRLYVEFAAALPGIEFGAIQRARWERAVVAQGFFGDSLPPGRILAVQGLHLQSVASPSLTPHLVAARVAGFDHAVYGLPPEAAPLLFEHPEHRWLVATTCLSSFVTGRYAPVDAWLALWRRILQWLAGDAASIPPLTCKRLVAPAYGRNVTMPEQSEARALASGLRWFRRSGMLPRADQEPQLANHAEAGIAAWPADGEPGDGSHGILEGQMSVLQPDGSQMVSIIRRCDCICESALSLALGGDARTASNLLDYVHTTSAARQGGRSEPDHPAYGHIAWGVTNEAWLKANYGDDNARILLSTAAAAGVLGDDRWNESMALCVLANLRTSSRFGFRPGRIDMEALEENGWEHYFASDLVMLHPHYECYLWACFLWAYEASGDRLFYRRALAAITRVMEAGPDNWQWTNGLAQERARMLLPLAWLVRVDDTAEHRRWLRNTAAGMIALQDDCGAIGEELGDPSRGNYPPPASNEDYGKHEAALIQANGDPVADLLYTTNFAFLGLHEAAAATGEALFQDAADRLADFLCRCQVRSEERPEIDGAWFRAFDFSRWEPWGSDADAGWGAWAVESGWTQGWITTVLALRQQRSSLWDLATVCGVGDHLRHHRPKMIPDGIVADVERMG